MTTVARWSCGTWTSSAPEAITVYRASAPDIPTLDCRGDMAEAAPAVPGWRLLLDELLP
jgi:hypothetical protein